MRKGNDLENAATKSLTILTEKFEEFEIMLNDYKILYDAINPDKKERYD